MLLTWLEPLAQSSSSRPQLPVSEVFRFMVRYPLGISMPLRPLIRFAAALTCLLMFTVAPSLQAQSGISLTIPASVRGEAMGGLFVTQSNDYSARWANPAMLAFMDDGTLGLMYSKLVPDLADDVFFMFGGWLTPISGLGTMALDLTYLSYGESQATDDLGNSKGSFTSYEVSPAAGFGFKFLPNLGVGISAKYIRIDLAPEFVLSDQGNSGAGVGTSWAFDLGALYARGPLRLATTVSNLGPDVTFIDAQQSDALPRTLRVGGTYDIFNNEVGEVRLGAEYEQSLVVGSSTTLVDSVAVKNDVWRSPVYHLGGEFVYGGVFAVRAGYWNDKDGDVNDWTAGFGFTWANAALEYASVPQAQSLKHVNRFALWYKY